MGNQDNREQFAPKQHSRSNRNILTVVGAVAVLGIASLSAYVMSGDTTVKPASGSAQAMSLATSNNEAR